MNKKITKNIIAAFLVAFIAIGVNAQILGDYDEAVTGGLEAVDTVPVNSTTRLYVYPDPVFSPTYVPLTNANRGPNQEWEWYDSTGAGAIIKAATALENWIDYTAPGAAGRQDIYTVESNSAVTCDGSFTQMFIDVINTPTVAFNTTDGTPIFYGTAGAPLSLCESDNRTTTDAFQAVLTHYINGNSDVRAQLHYRIVVDTSDDGGATWTNLTLDSTVYADYSGAGTQITALTVPGISHTLIDPQNPNYGTSGFVTINGAVTRYTYEILGVTDRITRKSDYDGVLLPGALQGWTLYDTVIDQARIVINPVPITGPIYHISNTWAN